MGNSISQHQLTAFLSLKAGQFFVGVQSCLAAAMSCLSLFGLFSLNSEIMEKVKPKPTDQRLFDRLVQTVHHPWPDAFPGLCQ
jgi:hypothetical protein